MICHNEKAGFVLGLNTPQMNREHDYSRVVDGVVIDGAVADNQLRTLDHIGLFANPLPAPPADLPRLADPADQASPLDRRARAYLHANCSICHRGGGGGNADFRLLYPMTLDQTQTIDMDPMHGGLGVDNAKIVRPGDPPRSVLYTRMAAIGEGRMPHIGSLEVDQAGANLVKEWILQLGRDAE